MGIEITDINEICFIENYETIKAIISPIEERKLIGELKAMRVYVYNKEGVNVPHFHINKIDNRSCCLKIKELGWFIHGKNNGTLSKKELKLLYEWLNQNNKKEWKSIITEWNKHTQNKLDIEIEIPEYFSL